jgi:hypothetical protein
MRTQMSNKYLNKMRYGDLEHTHRLKKILCAELLHYFNIKTFY